MTEVVKFKFRFRIYPFSSYVVPSQIVSSRNGMVGRRFNVQRRYPALVPATFERLSIIHEAASEAVRTVLVFSCKCALVFLAQTITNAS